MTDKKISAMTAATTPLSGSELVPGVDDLGNNVAITTQSIANLGGGGGGAGTLLGYQSGVPNIVEADGLVDVLSFDDSRILTPGNWVRVKVLAHYTSTNIFAFYSELHLRSVEGEFAYTNTVTNGSWLGNADVSYPDLFEWEVIFGQSGAGGWDCTDAARITFYDSALNKFGSTMMKTGFANIPALTGPILVQGSVSGGSSVLKIQQITAEILVFASP